MKECEVKRCDRKVESNGVCKSHRQRQRRNLPLYCDCGEPIPLKRGSHLNECLACKESRTCDVDNCNEKSFQKGYCPAHYMKWYRGSLGKRNCDSCGQWTGSDDYSAKYCKDCRNRIWKDSWRQNERQRREIMRGIESEKFTSIQVYNLDEQICYLCQEYIEFSDLHLDHIIPLTKSGSSGRLWNIASTHSRCNQRKNNILIKDCQEKFPNCRLPERFLAWQQSIIPKDYVAH